MVCQLPIGEWANQADRKNTLLLILATATLQYIAIANVTLQYIATATLQYIASATLQCSAIALSTMKYNATEHEEQCIIVQCKQFTRL